MNDQYLSELDILTHTRRPSDAARRDGWYKIGCVTLALLLFSVLAAFVSAH
jgi:hypothetical protein